MSSITDVYSPGRLFVVHVFAAQRSEVPFANSVQSDAPS